MNNRFTTGSLLGAALALFGTAAIDLLDWAMLAGIGAMVFVIIELEKSVARRIRGNQSRR